MYDKGGLVSLDENLGTYNQVLMRFDSNKTTCAFNVADMKQKIVPGSFPGTIAIVDDKVNNTLLHPDY